METISNVVNTVSATATKAIWGEQSTAGNETTGNEHVEPVNGKQGKGTATDPFDQGNVEDPIDSTTHNETAQPINGLKGQGTVTESFDQDSSADATNPTSTDTTSLPIREKSSASTEIPDLASKSTIPTADAFNSATAANASTAAHTSTFTSPTETITDDAGVSGTKNLSNTLSKTETDTEPEHKALDGGSETPGLAGFGNDRAIDPNDKTQIPTEVSNVTSGGVSKSFDDTRSAGLSGTKNLSETIAKINIPSTSPVTTPTLQGAEAPSTMTSSIGTSAIQEKKTAADGSNFDASKPGAAKEADRLLEEKGAHKDASDRKAESPSGEKEKVSKMEKLKEKLHIGHKH